MQIVQRRPRPVPEEEQESLTNEEIESMLAWIGLEVRAERAFPWYRAHGPSRFIAGSAPWAN